MIYPMMIKVNFKSIRNEKATARPACGLSASTGSRAQEALEQSETALPETPVKCCCAMASRADGAGIGWIEKARLRRLLSVFVDLGLKQIQLYFSIFIGVGYLVNIFVPTSIVSALLGADNFAAVPRATVIGLPSYLTTESSIPIIQSFLASGASEGATGLCHLRFRDQRVGYRLFDHIQEKAGAGALRGVYPSGHHPFGLSLRPDPPVRVARLDAAAQKHDFGKKESIMERLIRVDVGCSIEPFYVFSRASGVLSPRSVRWQWR